MREFRAGGHRGFLPEVEGDPRTVHARKRERQVQVRFAGADELIATLEGNVQARAGDAIITGVAGEQWPVPRAIFAQHYRALAPTLDGEAGAYLTATLAVRAWRMDEAFCVHMADGMSVLQGRPGDWLLDHGNGALGIIDPAIFSLTYQLDDQD